MESLLLKALRGVHLLNLSGMTRLAHMDRNIFIVRPWIETVSKEDLKQYLQSHNWTWREDESNTSPKYLRNRVRNELVPLLQDLTGDSLEVRLDAWIQQSAELARDVQPRVEDHLDKVLKGDSRGKGTVFDWVTSCDLIATGEASSLIQSQALFQWMIFMSQHVTQEFHGEKENRVISNQSLQRLLDQLRDYPDQTQWTIELGQNQSIRRRGSVLEFLLPRESNSDSTEFLSHVSELSWELLRPDFQSPNPSTASADSLVVSIDTRWISSKFQIIQMSVNDLEARQRRKDSTGRANGQTVWFVPPWKDSKVKLRQFLRGQGVSLHQRDGTLVLVAILSTTSAATFVPMAVQIEKPSPRWILHKDFVPTTQQGENFNNEAKTLLRISLN